jgi:histidine triad (HIT) family protein
LQLFAKKVAKGIQKAIPCQKVGVMVLGLEVPHAHIHLVPMQTEADLLNFSKKQKFSPEEFQEIAKLIALNID